MKAHAQLALLTLTLIQAAHAQDISAVLDKLRVTFPDAVEEQLALSAAPPHLRAEASVYLFGTDGYRLLRAGTNGFTCLLNRDAFYYGAAQFKPTCWDAAGSDSYVPVMLKVGELLAQGQSASDIQAAVEEGFADGTFHGPTRGGIAYMLAGDLVLESATGAITRQVFPGHYMLYALGATSEQLGYSPEVGQADPSLPLVFAGGAGGAELAYIIVVPGAH